MKKFISKIRKVIVLVFGTILALQSKIFASSSNIFSDKIVAMYGVPDIKVEEKINIPEIAKLGALLLTLIIGLTVFFKKSKRKTKQKIIIMIEIVVIIVAIYLVINNIIKS